MGVTIIATASMKEGSRKHKGVTWSTPNLSKNKETRKSAVTKNRIEWIIIVMSTFKNLSTIPNFYYQ
jgi:hypothetical protein